MSADNPPAAVVLPLIFTPSVFAILYWAAFCLWAIPDVIGALTRRREIRRQEATGADRRSFTWLVMGLSASLAISLALPWLTPSANLARHQPPVVTAGALLILLGVVIRWHAIRTLGRYFTFDVAVSADQPVVESGLYRWIRHPSYTGTLITILGVGLGLGNWLSLVLVLAAALATLLYRVRVEEQALCRAIGRPYLDYMQRTRRLIPFIF